MDGCNCAHCRQAVEGQEVSTRYFVERDSDGSVSHLARVFDSGTELWGEFYIDGEWQRHESATDYLFDQSPHEEIDEKESEAIVTALAARTALEAEQVAQPGKATAAQADAIRKAFHQFLPGGGPELPDPIPDRGQVFGNDWSVQYALNMDDDGRPRLDFLAQNRVTEPFLGQVSHDGTAVALDSFKQHLSYDPDVEGDKLAAEHKMREHNSSLEQQLKQRRLA